MAAAESSESASASASAAQEAPVLADTLAETLGPFFGPLLAPLLADPGLDLLVLFTAAFGAATILPFYSEVLVVGLLLAGREPVLVFLVATVGNTLGAVVNWWIGGALERWRETGAGPRWLHPRAVDVERAQRWYARFGVWSLLLAWLPIGGDALTFIAGVMRVGLTPFLVLVAIGKSLRYGVLVVGTLGLL